MMGSTIAGAKISLTLKAVTDAHVNGTDESTVLTVLLVGLLASLEIGSHTSTIIGPHASSTIEHHASSTIEHHASLTIEHHASLMVFTPNDTNCMKGSVATPNDANSNSTWNA
jgi:hypothetical protein